MVNPLHTLTTCSQTPDPEYVDKYAQMINRYGFMIVFSVIILILLVVFFVTFNSRAGKKANSEVEILKKERLAYIDQNKETFNLVTDVQTKQVIQLQEMTSMLREMNRSIQEDRMSLIETNENFQKIKDNIIECDENSKIIINTLTDILDYVKTSQTCNREILEKVNILEKNLLGNNDENL